MGGGVLRGPSTEFVDPLLRAIAGDLGKKALARLRPFRAGFSIDDAVGVELLLDDDDDDIGRCNCNN
jgi:hypothetical protein